MHLDCETLNRNSQKEINSTISAISDLQEELGELNSTFIQLATCTFRPGATISSVRSQQRRHCPQHQVSLISAGIYLCLCLILTRWIFQKCSTYQSMRVLFLKIIIVRATQFLGALPSILRTVQDIAEGH